MRTPVTLSETAARRLHSLAKSEGRPLMLRVAVEAGVGDRHVAEERRRAVPGREERVNAREPRRDVASEGR